MKTILQRLETSDGYLRDASLDFSEGLTCIIGARGTCKSTVVETLRFAHDLDHDRIATLTDAHSSEPRARGPRGLLRETMAGGTALCTLTVMDEQGSTSQLRLERSLDARRPRAYRDNVVDPELSAHEAPIEIYSQGDLLAIAENPQERLQLIDRPHLQQIAQIQARLRENHQQIESLGHDIMELRASIREDARELVPLPELKQQLETLSQTRPILDPHFEQERAEYEKRERLSSRVRAYVHAFGDLLPQPHLPIPDERERRTIEREMNDCNLKSARVLADDLRQLADTTGVLEQRLREAHALVARADASLRVLDAELEHRNERYRSLRREEEKLSASLEQEDRLRAQVRRMDQLRDDLEKREARLRALLDRREASRQAAESCLDEIFALRLRQIEQIDAELDGAIALEIVQGAQAGPYVDAISELLQGTRLKRQRDIASRIADLIPPADLVDLIESEHTDRLAELASLEMSQASRIIHHFVDNMSGVLALETLMFEDQLNITMNIGEGEARPIEQLSRGQMATALLPLVLRHADFPLVFDQPEDDLDNRFVFNELVTRVRKLKLTRQLIFVTHNANIPVLGEAERVIVMSMASARRASPVEAGTVDQMRQPILDILEGGADAFAERKRRYEGMV